MRRVSVRAAALSGGVLLAFVSVSMMRDRAAKTRGAPPDSAQASAAQLVDQGRQTFRFDTFGDEAFWGGQLQLHKAIEGAALGGVGPGVSPLAALGAGLKVDLDALPNNIVGQIASGQISLSEPATTVALLKMNAVVGVTGFFNGSGSLQSIGIQCAMCHSTVDDAAKMCPPGFSANPGTGCVGHRLDGWPNRDLNVGAIVALSPNLNPLVQLLHVDDAGVRSVLNSWGPGKFDAELILDGKAFNPSQETDHVVTSTHYPGATLIPPAFGLGGVNLHTWTGWGSIPYWNAFVAVVDMHGVGRFWDPRVGDAQQFPIAAANGFSDLPHISPDDDRVTPKLQALQMYQLAIPSPEPPKNSFDPAAAKRGDDLFSGKARCNQCHVEPLWTEPGWNMHAPAEVCIDSFQADRAPDHRYRTAPIGDLFTHSKGGFYHDGRFNGPDINTALMKVVNHYDSCMGLNLSGGEKNDLIQYLLSLTFGPSSQ